MAEGFPYQLSLDPELEAFRPEIEFACGFIDHCYGLQRSDHGPVLHYGKSSQANAIHVPATLFPDSVRIGNDGIRLDRSRFSAIERQLLPMAATPGDHGLPYDAIGLIFLMLSRVEERDCQVLDRHGRFPAIEAFTVRHGLHLDPPADRAAQDVAARLTGDDSPCSRTRFSLRLTHDVDRLRAYHRPFDWVRPALGDAIRRRDPRAAWRRVALVTRSGEPWQSFRRLMDIEEAHGVRGHYYFMGPSQLEQDSPYAASMAGLLRQVIDEVVRRGHTVGFHPGYATMDDPAEWHRQRAGIEAIAGVGVREGRQHVLRYRADLTPEIWDDEGMEYDCSLAFPESTGFRSGSCRPYHAYSLRCRRRLALRQGSSAVCDFALLGDKYRSLSDEQALAECDAALSVCRRYGGELVVLFHTGLPDKSWYRFFERLMPRMLGITGH